MSKRLLRRWMRVVSAEFPIWCFIHNCLQCVATENCVSSWNKTSCGAPQGRVLVPFFFIAYVNDIVVNLPEMLPLHFVPASSVQGGMQMKSSIGQRTTSITLPLIISWLPITLVCRELRSNPCGFDVCSHHDDQLFRYCSGYVCITSRIAKYVHGVCMYTA